MSIRRPAAQPASRSCSQALATVHSALAFWRSGCTLTQLCPCDGPRGSSAPWRNHGKHVSCTARAANQFVDAGLMTTEEKDAAVSAAAGSDCGH